MEVVRDISWYKSEAKPLDFPPCGFDGICEKVNNKMKHAKNFGIIEKFFPL
jgi:hypothetical protein